MSGHSFCLIECSKVVEIVPELPVLYHSDWPPAESGVAMTVLGTLKPDVEFHKCQIGSFLRGAYRVSLTRCKPVWLICLQHLCKVIAWSRSTLINFVLAASSALRGATNPMSVCSPCFSLPFGISPCAVWTLIDSAAWNLKDRHQICCTAIAMYTLCS